MILQHGIQINIDVLLSTCTNFIRFAIEKDFAMNNLLEICAGDIDSVLAAAHGGAARVELCSALAVGGITPSEGFIRRAVAVPGIKKNVLIRPREGDFIYTPDEVAIMLDDVAMAARCGADGVVVGALLPDGSIDTSTCSRLADAARSQGLSLTFHRAFDRTADAVASLESIIAMGFDRILTSGLAPTALEGAATLKQLCEIADGRISILAGSGINSRNAAEIARRSGCHELHASARHTVPSTASFSRTEVAMGSSDSDTRLTTDVDEVRAIVAAINTKA